MRAPHVISAKLISGLNFRSHFGCITELHFHVGKPAWLAFGLLLFCASFYLSAYCFSKIPSSSLRFRFFVFFLAWRQGSSLGRGILLFAPYERRMVEGKIEQGPDVALLDTIRRDPRYGLLCSTASANLNLEG